MTAAGGSRQGGPATAPCGRPAPHESSPKSGFALVITLVLLALLVLVVLALGMIGRVGTDVSTAGTYQVQARQHALLALNQALGELHRHAGGDDCRTGIAGITGIAAGSDRPARHWAGVWTIDGSLAGWLASGALKDEMPGLSPGEAIALVANGSVGADGRDQEHVRVLRLPVVVPTRDRGAVRLGSYAWVVLDEGVKLSAVLPSERHAIDALIPLAPDAPLLSRAATFEQLRLVSATLAPRHLRGTFHALGRTHLGLSGSGSVPGALNVNTNSAPFWRGVAATYNRLKPAAAPILSADAFSNSMSARVPDADPAIGKRARGPFLSVDQFLRSASLASALDASGGSADEFRAVMRPWLAVRSDTFRVRAFGESVNPADVSRTEAVAWCEALVQRVKRTPGDPAGRFMIMTFRWLRGPNPGDPLESDI